MTITYFISYIYLGNTIYINGHTNKNIVVFVVVVVVVVFSVIYIGTVGGEVH